MSVVELLQSPSYHARFVDEVVEGREALEESISLMREFGDCNSWH